MNTFSKIWKDRTKTMARSLIGSKGNVRLKWSRASWLNASKPVQCALYRVQHCIYENKRRNDSARRSFPAFLYEVTSEWPDPRQATILPSHPHLHIIILHRRQFSPSSQHSGIDTLPSARQRIWANPHLEPIAQQPCFCTSKPQKVGSTFSHCDWTRRLKISPLWGN